MRAEEARKLSDLKMVTFDEVISLIQDSARKGGRCVEVFYLDKDLHLKLKRLGYNIEFFPERLGSFVTISW